MISVALFPRGASLDFSSSDGKAQLKSGRSKFTLATLPANEFPSVDEGEKSIEFGVQASTLKALIEATSFAMAQQDVRYYLNGMLWEVSTNKLRAVATDGHRMALCDGDCEVEVEGTMTWPNTCVCLHFTAMFSRDLWTRTGAPVVL